MKNLDNSKFLTFLTIFYSSCTMGPSFCSHFERYLVDPRKKIFIILFRKSFLERFSQCLFSQIQTKSMSKLKNFLRSVWWWNPHVIICFCSSFTGFERWLDNFGNFLVFSTVNVFTKRKIFWNCFYWSW